MKPSFSRLHTVPLSGSGSLNNRATETPNMLPYGPPIRSTTPVRPSVRDTIS